jgi:hypothetical protein
LFRFLFVGRRRSFISSDNFSKPLASLGGLVSFHRQFLLFPLRDAFGRPIPEKTAPTYTGIRTGDFGCLDELFLRGQYYIPARSHVAVKSIQGWMRSGVSSWRVLDQFFQVRAVKRVHVISWRKDMEIHQLSTATIRRKLSALASLFDHLCDRNTVLRQPCGRRQAAARGECRRRRHAGAGRRADAKVA